MSLASQRHGMADGDIRVLLVLDVALSAAFAALALYLGELGGLVAFTTTNLLVATAALAALTYLAVLR
jgi:hypothetical protein